MKTNKTPQTKEEIEAIYKKHSIEMGKRFEFSIAFDECVKEGWLPADYHKNKPKTYI